MDTKLTRKGFVFNEQDVERLEQIKKAYGVIFDSEAVRIALRKAVE